MLYVLVTVSGHDNPLDTSLTKVNVAVLMVPPTELADPPAPVKAAKFAYAGCSVIEHTAVRFAGGVSVGKVFITVMVKVCGVPVHPFNAGVTVIVATTVVPGVPFSAVKAAMLPVPDAASPIDGVLLVQLKVAPTVPVKFTAVVVAFAHKLWSAGSVTVGIGFTVMVNVCAVPVHPASVGVTVIVATTGVVPALVAVKDAMLPLPLAASPIDGVLLVQLKVAPAVPVKFTAVVAVFAHKV